MIIIGERLLPAIKHENFFGSEARWAESVATLNLFEGWQEEDDLWRCSVEFAPVDCCCVVGKYVVNDDCIFVSQEAARE